MRQVSIVGGGLAGAITALHLLERNVPVRVLERNAPGTTLCGEGLSAPTLRALDVFDATPFVDRSFDGARWRFPGATVIAHRRCHTMARETWIPAMLEAVADRGGTVETGVRVGPDQLDGLLREGMVIGADGPGSRVRQRVEGAQRHIHTRTGIQVRFETDADTDHLEFVTSKRFSKEYAWWFPRGDSHNIGLLAEDDGQDWRRLEAFIDHLGIEGTVRKKEAYPIAFGGRRFVSQDGRVLLIGDAAGLTNPLTKGGIAAVVHAAPLLAEAVAKGRPHEFQRRLARHPLTLPAYQRVLRRLRAWDDARLVRLVATAPKLIHVGGPTTPALPVALRTAARAPWRIPALLDFYRSTVGSMHWSW